MRPLARNLLVGALLVAIVVGLWTVTRDGDSADAIGPTAAEVEPLRPAPSADLDGTAEAAREAPAPEPARVVAAEGERSEQPVATTPDEREPEPAVPGRDERGWLELLITDRAGAGIATAEVRMDGLRTQDSPAAHYAWPTDPSEGVTDAGGRVRVWYPLWVRDVDLTGAVSFRVEHPDFVPHRELSFSVEDGGGTIELDRGAFVVVTGWVGAPSRTVLDVVPRVTDAAGVSRKDWSPLSDGRQATNRIPPGEHGITIAWRDEDGARWHSAVEMFALEAGEQRELALELVAPIAFEGRLDAGVPRPIEDGVVQIGVQTGTSSARARMLRTFTTTVDAEGAFRFEGLPPGQGEMIGLADHWISSRVPTRDLRILGVEEVDDELRLEARIATAQERLGEHGLRPQPVDTTDTRPFVLAMEPCATLEVDVADPDGRPLAGATVSTWPNVTWSLGYSQMFLERTFACTTDASGRCTIVDLPGGGAINYGVQHAELVLPLVEQAYGPARRMGRVTLVAGETASIELQLEREE